MKKILLFLARNKDLLVLLTIALAVAVKLVLPTDDGIKVPAGDT